MYKYLIAKCPLSGGEHTASDWWTVLSRHRDFECAEDSFVKITNKQKATDKHIIFKLKGYQVGEHFNIKDIQARHKV